MPISQYETLRSEVNAELVDIDLYKQVWTDREFKETKSFSHSEWSDRSSKEKLSVVRDTLKKKKCYCYIGVQFRRSCLDIQYKRRRH